MVVLKKEIRESEKNLIQTRVLTSLLGRCNKNMVDDDDDVHLGVTIMPLLGDGVTRRPNEFYWKWIKENLKERQPSR